MAVAIAVVAMTIIVIVVPVAIVYCANPITNLTTTPFPFLKKKSPVIRLSHNDARDQHGVQHLHS